MKHLDLLFNILTAAALGVAIIVAPTAARAAADEATGLYIGAGVGESDVDTNCGVPGGVTTGCDTKNTGWKAYLGFQFNKYLGVEGGYVRFGDVNASGTALGVPFSATTETWGIPVYAVGSIPIPLDSTGKYKISLFGKAGAIRWDQERNSSLPNNSGDGTGWDFAYGLGVQFTLNEHLGIRAEWEKFNDIGTSTTGPNDIQMWTVGVNYKF